MVTILNNLVQVFLGLCVSPIRDLLIKTGVFVRTVWSRHPDPGHPAFTARPIPVLLPHQLPLHSAVVVIQVLCSFRVFGTLAGYSSYCDISPTFQRPLFGMGSMVSVTLPGTLFPNKWLVSRLEPEISTDMCSQIWSA